MDSHDPVLQEAALDPQEARDGQELVMAALTRDAWANLCEPLLDDAESMGEAGALEVLTEIMSWVVPVMVTASGDPELRAREQRIRETYRVYLDDATRARIQSFARRAPRRS